MVTVRDRDTGPQPDYSILQCHGRSVKIVAVRANGARSPRSILQHCMVRTEWIQCCNVERGLLAPLARTATISADLP